MGAYETLWTKAGATFKTIADRFRAKPSTVPSDFLQSAVAYKFAEEVVGILRRGSVTKRRSYWASRSAAAERIWAKLSAMSCWNSSRLWVRASCRSVGRSKRSSMVMLLRYSVKDLALQAGFPLEQIPPDSR